LAGGEQNPAYRPAGLDAADGRVLHHPPGRLAQQRSGGARGKPAVYRLRGRKVFFSEEKKQKTFTSLSPSYPATQTKDMKVFWFSFLKTFFHDWVFTDHDEQIYQTD
jgi:hypothetical protein